MLGKASRRCGSVLIALLASLVVLGASAPPGPTPRDETTIAVRDAGLEAYRAGDLEGAATAWRERLERGRETLHANERARLCYDLGNVAYRRGDELAAVGWYTAALRLRPRDADTWANLELARSEAGLPPADRGDLAATADRLLFAFTRGESEWLLLAAVLAWAVVLAGEALRGGRAWRVASLAGLGLVLVAATPRVAHALRADDDPVLVVQKDGARVRSEPRADAEAVSALEPGAEAEVLDRLPDWVKVATPDGPDGWVRERDVFPLRW